MKFNIMGFIISVTIMFTAVMQVVLAWMNFKDSEIFHAYFLSSLGWALASLLHIFNVKTHK